MSHYHTYNGLGRAIAPNSHTSIERQRPVTQAGSNWPCRGCEHVAVCATGLSCWDFKLYEMHAGDRARAERNGHPTGREPMRQEEMSRIMYERSASGRMVGNKRQCYD